MHGEHTSMDLRTVKRPPIAVLSTGRPMASVIFWITLIVDVNMLKAEDSSSLVEDAVLWELIGSPLLEGAAPWGLAGSLLLEGVALWEPAGSLFWERAVLWELDGSSFLCVMNFEKDFLNTFMVVSVRDMRVHWPVSVLIYTTEHEADALILILFARGRAASNMRVHSRRLRRLRYHSLV